MTAPRPAMPPLEPSDAQEQSVRRTQGRKASNRDRVLHAMEQLRAVATSLSLRRAIGCSLFETDAAQRVVEDSISRLRSVYELLERGKRRTP